jgi:hypothetical protein
MKNFDYDDACRASYDSGHEDGTGAGQAIGYTQGYNDGVRDWHNAIRNRIDEIIKEGRYINLGFIIGDLESMFQKGQK